MQEDKPKRVIKWRAYQGDPLQLSLDEIERANAGCTVVVRPQVDGTWMIAAINIRTGLPRFNKVPFVENEGDIQKVVQMEREIAALWPDLEGLESKTKS